MTTLVRNAKTNYDNLRINTNVPCKQLWKNIKNLGIAKNKQLSINCDSSADEINDYFAENFSSNETENDNTVSMHGDFSFRCVEDYEIVNALFTVKSNACGLDNLPIVFFKIMLPLALPLYTHLFNTIITSSKFPQAWKCVKIIPIKKKSRSNSISNLRPISLLNALSKAFEKIISYQVSEYVSVNNYLSPNQSGFRKNHSTETALMKVHDDIASTIDKKGIAILLLIDFAKAFDRVSHQKLLHKLASQFKFSQSAVNLLRTYLIGRNQTVLHNDTYSSLRSINSGVPQGSIIGPLLFHYISMIFHL